MPRMHSSITANQVPAPAFRIIQMDVANCIAMDLLELRWEDKYNPALVGQFEELNAGLYVLVCVDAGTKWPSISVLTDKEAHTVANAFLNDVVPIYWSSLRIISDLG